MNKEDLNKIKIAIHTAEGQLNILKKDVKMAERAGVAGAVDIGNKAIAEAEAKLRKMKLAYGA